MTLLGGILILLPNLDGLVRLATDQAQARAIKGRAHDARLGIQTPGLRGRVQALKAVARLPVPEADAPVIAAGEEDVVFVDGEGVDDGIMAVKVLHEGAFGALPLLDRAGAGGSKGEFFGVHRQGAHAFFVVGEDAHGFAGGEIPEADGRVEGRGDDLRVGFLAFEVGDGAFVAGENVDVAAGAHVPDAGDAITAAGDEDVQGWVKGEGVDAAEMAVVVADHFVGFEIPAFDHFVFATGEEVGMAR
jgi:hypothetical protein